MKQKNKPKCPKCSSNINVVEIKYGFPGLEMQDEEAKGQIEGWEREELIKLSYYQRHICIS